MDIRVLSMQRFIMYFKEANSGVHSQKFCFVLGAGASISSGIPSGEALVKTWERELTEAEGSEHEKWKQDLSITSENQAEFYSTYYKKRFLEPSDGYNYMEQQMDTARPSVGYAALAYLLCRKESNSNIVLTTNFDHLSEDAVSRQQKVLPLVVGHEALAHYVTHYIKEGVKRPVIVKIHRDLLMEPISTPEKLDTLHEKWIPPLNELFSHYHPVFIGYAGNDKSLMQFLLSNLAKFQSGEWKLPYWTIYGNAPIHGMAKQLMEQTGGYVIYGVDFDDFLILLGDALNFKLKTEEDAVRELKEEREAFTKKINEVLEKRAKAKRLPKPAEASGEDPDSSSSPVDPSGGKSVSGSPNDGPLIAPKVQAASDPESPSAAEPSRLNDAYGRITGDSAAANRRMRHMQSIFTRNTGDYAKAEQIQRQLTVEEPDNAEYHHSLAVTLHAMKRYDEAEAERRRAVELEPDSARYHQQLGVTLHAMKRYEEAEAESRRAVELEPDNAAYHDSLGTTLHEMQRYAEAEAESRRALELEPDNAEYHRSLSVTLRELKRWPEAEAEARYALARRPEDAYCHGTLGLTLHAMERYAEAEAELRRAVELEPDDPENHENLAKTLRALGKAEEAAQAEAKAAALQAQQGR